jgi:peptidoglycan/LPS O-acetylase OafA/YrhL
VLVSLPLFIVAGKSCGRRGPVMVIAGSLAAPVLLAALAAFAAVGHIPAVLPLAAFAGIMFAWSFLSGASPALFAVTLLRPTRRHTKIIATFISFGAFAVLFSPVLCKRNEIRVKRPAMATPGAGVRGGGGEGTEVTSGSGSLGTRNGGGLVEALL